MSKLIPGNTYITTDNGIKKIKEIAYQQGRADAIDEVIRAIDEYGIYFENDNMKKYFCYLMAKIRRKQNE